MHTQLLTNLGFESLVFHCKTLKNPQRAIASNLKKDIHSPPGLWDSIFRSASEFQAQKLRPSQDQSRTCGSPPPNFLPNACSRPLYAHSITSSPLWWLVAAWWDGSLWDFRTSETTHPFCGCPSTVFLPSLLAASPGSLIHPEPGSLIEVKSLPVPNLDDPHLSSPPSPKPPLFSPMQSHSQTTCCHSPFISHALILVLIEFIPWCFCMPMHNYPSIHIHPSTHASFPLLLQYLGPTMGFITFERC